MRITIVNDEMGIWEVLYVEGKKFTEGHRLSSQDWINFMLHQGFIDSVEHKMINNTKYDYEYSDGNRHCEPTFHKYLSQFEDDDFQE